MGEQYIFKQAEIEDLPQIAKIEEEIFKEYERTFHLEFLMKWYEHNAEMFYVVKDVKNRVLGFIILVPINERLYCDLHQGKVSDLYEFNPKDVLTTDATDYFYIADICVQGTKANLKASGKLFYEAAKFLYKKARYIITSPITSEGMLMCKHLKFSRISEQLYKGTYYPIYELKVPEKGKKLLSVYEKMIGKEGL